MDCRKVSRLLSAYIEGDLSLREKSDFEEHVKSCSNCAEKLADIRLIRQAAGELEKVTR